MRTCFLHLQQKNRRWLRRLSCAALFALSAIAGAQTLARPGWAGSGVAIEPWWRRAVFYRIDPANFQDSDGDGKGDLAGIAQRIGYLQQLGIDAIVLRLPLSSTSRALLPNASCASLSSLNQKHLATPPTRPSKPTSAPHASG